MDHKGAGVKERPILFSAPMVRAILAGEKTQTRRIVKSPHVKSLTQLALEYGAPIESNEYGVSFDADGVRAVISVPLSCPYGSPGDRLWVKEQFSSERQEQAGTGAVRWVVIDSGGFAERCGAYYRATYDPVAARARRWRPSIHMPRCLSRITLEVTRVRVEQLHAITESDAKAEGVAPFLERYPTFSPEQRIEGDRVDEKPYRTSFVCLWDEINGDRMLFSANPWVWVVDFKAVQP